jgi:hypothetical protein
MTLVSGEPSTIEELAEEEAESWDHLLGPSTRDAMKRLLADLYATHPVMKRLAEERLGDREAVSTSNERNLYGVELERKLRGG